jgi:hypothetical protein
VDNLTSTSTDSALTAAQGSKLYNMLAKVPMRENFTFTAQWEGAGQNILKITGQICYIRMYVRTRASITLAAGADTTVATCPTQMPDNPYYTVGTQMGYGNNAGRFPSLVPAIPSSGRTIMLVNNSTASVTIPSGATFFLVVTYITDAEI